MAPVFSKVSHISFSARDAQESADWWSDVMGFEQFERSEGEGWFGIMLIHRPTRTIIEFQQHDANRGELFDPARTGFDHMGLLVQDPADLAVWEEHFRTHGVEHTPTADKDYGMVLTFKDPDRRQFEMFYRPNHP